MDTVGVLGQCIQVTMGVNWVNERLPGIQYLAEWNSYTYISLAYFSVNPS